MMSLSRLSRWFKENGIVTIAKGAQDAYSVWGTMSLLCRFGYFDHIWNILNGTEDFNNARL